MPSKKMLQGNSQYIKEWENFIKTGEVDASVMRREIIDSWHRSKKYGVDPLSTKIKIELTGHKLEQTKNVFKPILDIALPFMEMIYDAVGEIGMVVSFTDADGFIMASLGDENVFSELQLHTGKNISEEQVGTNAIGIALKKGVALQVLGAEHYRKAYHKKTT